MPPMNQLSSGGIGGRDSFRGSGSAVGSRPLIYNNNKITTTDGAGAVRLLHDKEIDGKKLVAKVDAKTRSCSMTTRRRINWCLGRTGNEMFARVMEQQKHPFNPDQRNSVLEKANRRSLLRSVALQACQEQEQIPQVQRRRKFLGVHAGNRSEQQALARYAIRPCPPRFRGESIGDVSYGAFYDTNFQKYRNTFYESSSSGEVGVEQSDGPERQKVKPHTSIVKKLEIFETDD
ncbi:hypothetical protein pipiens_007102 [Culex pipiens pipiens]|uniref:Uncharacterized protein n=1 Tax=Culex pipiens pipiens TaxID=38569 RepID=A0ABD1DM59_CULPP